MSTINKGILGGFSGKTGPVIGSSWKGKPVMRALPVFKKNRKFTQEQLDQQEKFALVGKLLHGISGLLQASFPGGNRQHSGLNTAMAYNLRQAISGSASPFAINFSRLKLAQGPLVPPARTAAEAADEKKVRFSWAFLPGLSGAKPSDQPVAVLYSEALQQFLYTKNTAAMRSDEELVVDARTLSGETIHAWLFFLSENGRKASDSMYLGTVPVGA